MPHLLSMIAELSEPEGRLRVARALAQHIGAQDLILFLPDADLGTLLPAPGFPQTLPHGQEWRKFLAACQSSAPHRGQLPFPDAATLTDAVGIRGECGALLMLLGGIPNMALAGEIALLLPLLAAAFRGERTARIAEGNARMASQSAEQAKLLATSLDKARSALRKALSDAETANHAKDRFLASLSHELRTPLTPVLLAAASYEVDLNLPQVVRRDMAMMRRNVELEVQLIDDLLDLSRVIAGKLRLRAAPLDINIAVRHATEMCLPYIREQGVTLTLDLTPGLDSVMADPTRLQQVLWNLLKNAVKFTPRGNVTVRTAAQTPDYVQVSVMDTGIGIDPGALERIFNAFEQETLETPHEFGGLGLGLAIAKAIMNLHGGHIHAASEGPGCGATFTISLSLSDQAVLPSEELLNDGDPVRDRAARILLVEDHEDTARILALLLEGDGHVVKSARLVSSALEMLESEGFDLLLSDVGLPDQPGYELMRIAAERYRIPGIAMTGYAMDEDVQRCRDAGFSEHLVKPVDIQVLKRTIQRILASQK